MSRNIDNLDELHDAQLDSLDALVVRLGGEKVRLSRLVLQDFNDLQPFFQATGAISRGYECNLIDLLLRPLHVFFTRRDSVVLVYITPHNTGIRRERAGFLPPLFQRDVAESSSLLKQIVKSVLQMPGARFVALSQTYLEASGLSEERELMLVRQAGDVEDYIYLRDDLITLNGSKAQREKRRQANNFERDYQPAVEEMAEKHFDGCIAVCESYRAEKGGDDAHPNVLRELGFTVKLLEQFHYLKTTLQDCRLRGIVVIVSDRVVAFSIVDALGTNAVVVHVEKAMASYKGAYQYVNRETVRNLTDEHIKYINRECARKGADGLKVAKSAYGPHCMVDKFVAYSSESPVESEIRGSALGKVASSFNNSVQQDAVTAQF